MTGLKRLARHARGAGCAVAFWMLLIASGLHAQEPPPPSRNAIEVVYSTNSSNNRILQLDFTAATSTVVKTDTRQRKRLECLAVRRDLPPGET